MEASLKRVQYERNKETLRTIINALMFCTQPLSCDPECSFYKEYIQDREREADFDFDPLCYCQAVMAARLSNVRGTLEDEA